MFSRSHKESGMRPLFGGGGGVYETDNHRRMEERLMFRPENFAVPKNVYAPHIG